MSDDLIIRKPYAYAHEVRGLDESIQGKECLRVYPDAPGHLQLQVRAFCAVTPNGTGKKRDMIAGVSLNLPEAKKLREALDSFIKRVEEENAG